MKQRSSLALIALIAMFSAAPAFAQGRKPNIVVIMGDDVGMWNIGAYHRGLMAGRRRTVILPLRNRSHGRSQAESRPLRKCQSRLAQVEGMH